ncbi:hypothetical protein LIER_07724 [Lithospermum erythrorhizon]|uniref:PHD-type domain-containing protein n=1 Tax=Lithospermum erythrorhizon TaxID=34254 RepID=A0AAV3PB00_LITER
MEDDLISKKKGQGGNGKGTDLSKKNKRARMLMSDSESGDELLVTMSRKAREKTHKERVGSKRSGERDVKFGSEEEFERKSGLDLFEFDEYDDFEGYGVRNVYADGNSKAKLGKRAWSSQEFKGSGSRKNSMSKKRKHSCMDGSHSVGGGKNKGVESGGGMSKLDLEEAEAQVPISLLSLKSQKTPEEPIRLQGKNGVLKVTANNNKSKLSPRGNGKNRLSESITPVRSKIETRIPSLSSTPVEGKVGSGGSTDKQQVRETIKEMLIKSSWSIDYRPRRNRDYLDAVYIHPCGTAYWSITKAYEALQKQFNDEEGRSKSAGLSSSFTPIPEDLLSKLTRQSRKKVEKKIKKRREDGVRRTSKQPIKEESVEEMDSDQPEETLSSYIRKKRKSSQDTMQDSCNGSGSESSDDSCERTTKGDEVNKSLGTTNNRMEPGSLGSLMQRCTLRIRELNKAQISGTDGYVAYSGKRTVLAWLIDSGIVQSGKKVRYMNHKRTRVRLEGWITKQGIHCGCCSKIVTVSKFELHAGSKLRRPFQNIFFESRVSLLQCLIDAWKQQDGSDRQDFYYIDANGEDPDDDTCGTCGDGGDLICCDSCPSTFHQSCLEIKMLPNGDWQCPNCVCKFCVTARRNDAGGDLSGDELTTCSLCERKYHKLCSTDNGATPVDSSNGTAQFCGQKCQELYDHLRKILGVKQELEEGFSWSLIRRTDIDSDVENSGFAQRVECNSKLAVAHSVIDECFLPIIDRRSGINLVHNVLYNCGANFPRLNYGSFYCAILERGDELISAASIRIHGTRLAEMPFIGTRHIYRRQGMCSQLLSAIELALSSFKVENLIIPAISEHMNTWTTTFGFNLLEEDLKEEIKYLNMLVFPGTDMLQKQLVKPMTGDAKAIDLTAGPRQPPALTRKAGDIEDDGNDAKVHLDKNLDKFDVDSGSMDSAAPANINGPSAPLAPDSTSKSGIQYPIAETTLDQNNQVVESGSKLSSSLSAPRTSLVGLEKPVDPFDKDSVQSNMETEIRDQPAGTVESSGKDLYDVPEDHEGSDAPISAKMDGNDLVHSDTTSDADVNIQSTCEVNTKDRDIADSSFDNVPEDVNGRSSLLEDGSENRCLGSSTDLNKPGVDAKDEVILVTAPEVATDAEVASAKPLTNTSLVCGVGNHDDNNTRTAPVEHANASADSMASEEIDEQSNFSFPAGGGLVNAESCVEQSEIKGEPCAVDQ